MPFAKGQKRPENAGRKKGSKNLKQIPRVQEYLAMLDINPAEEILKLLPLLDPHERVKAWGTILSYSQPKPRDDASPLSEGPRMNEFLTLIHPDFGEFPMTDAQLLEVIEGKRVPGD